MAKGARSSVRKTNNSKLKARVFGPVENARTERLSAKLLELASQPKPPRSEMETEQEDVADAKPTESQTKKTSDADDNIMEVDGAQKEVRTTSIKAEKRAKQEKNARIAKKRHRKTTNSMSFGKDKLSKPRGRK